MGVNLGDNLRWIIDLLVSIHFTERIFDSFYCVLLYFLSNSSYYLTAFGLAKQRNIVLGDGVFHDRGFWFEVVGAHKWDGLYEEAQSSGFYLRFNKDDLNITSK